MVVLFHKLIALTKMQFHNSSAYPGMLLLWMLEIFIIPITLLFVWLTIINSNPHLQPQRQILVNYYVILPIIALLASAWSGVFVAERIRTGELNPYLIKPLHIFYNYITVNFVEKIIKSVFLIPMVLVAAYGFKLQLSFDLPNLILGLVAASLGAVINFCLNLCLGLLAFWLDEVSALEELYDALYFTFGGRVIPIFLFPAALQPTLTFLPFRYLVSFPLEIIIGNLTFPQILIGFLVQAFWMGIGIFGIVSLWHKGVKRYQGFGG